MEATDSDRRDGTAHKVNFCEVLQMSGSGGSHFLALFRGHTKEGASLQEQGGVSRQLDFCTCVFVICCVAVDVARTRMVGGRQAGR